MNLATTDLTDAHPDTQVADPVFSDFGGSRSFSGQIETVKVFEDNVLVRATLETPGDGRVLVVDAGGSLRCALVGDVLAGLALEHGWVGVVMYGCVRDTAVTVEMPIGIKALAAHPRRSHKGGEGSVGIEVSFAGVTFTPGDWLYSDADGIAVSALSIHD